MRQFMRSLGRLGSNMGKRHRKSRVAYASPSCRLRTRSCRVEGLEQRALLAITGALYEDPLAVETAAAGTDFGDAPGYADASHEIGGPWLGPNAPDSESGSQPNANATGDDNAGTDDEDGITLPATMKAGNTYTVSYQISGTDGAVKGWIDFNQDGDWDDAGELIIDNFFPEAPGTYNVDVTVPEGALVGTTYARFRIVNQDAFVLGPAGAASDGEVEDYKITIDPAAGLDYGDAPDSYGTTAGAAGATHVVDVPGAPWLGGAGDAPDWEADGQPSVDALGDNNNGDDDENGVTFTTTLIPGQQGQLEYTVSGGDALITGWIDFDQNGVWDAENEFIMLDFQGPGTHSWTFDVPVEAELGDTYARFRIGSEGSIAPTGPATDGEVEDYTVTIGAEANLDWGDAPSPYPTKLADNGPRHTTSGPFFGPAGDNPDADPDGQPNATATGDDTDGNNDEDGVTIPNLSPAQTVTIQYTVGGGGGKVKGWIDLNGDGDWDDPGELVVDPGFRANGTYTQDLFVPLDAPAGPTYARFRIYNGNDTIDYTGPLANGEVEDHLVTIDPVTTIDWGDAPAPYPTTLADNGARHAIVPVGPYLGSALDVPDSEADGQPSPGADGDNLTGSNDENGIVFTTALIAGQDAQMQVTVSRAGGVLEGWIDFNGDGDWDDSGEAFEFPVFSPGSPTFGVPIPSGAVAGTTYARFRISSSRIGSPTGYALNGEVEDYEVQITNISWDAGDAPSPYPTLASQNGARHILGGPFMGPSVDPELDGQPSSQALGDDTDGNDDEDGVAFITPINAGSSSAALTVDMTSSPVDGLASVWIDFNADGDWNDSGERVAHDVPVAAGAVTPVTFSVPANMNNQATYARVRVSSAGGLGVTGVAPDGEVEDYYLDLTPVPGLPDLLPESDTGMFGDDDVTKLNNSDGNVLVFEVPDTIPGATVTLYANGTPIGSAVATTTVTTITTDNANVLLEGSNIITARQASVGLIESPDSSSLEVSVDTAAPQVSAPDLVDASDSGVFSDDNITNGIDPRFTGSATDPVVGGASSGVAFATIYSDDGRSMTQTSEPYYDFTMPTLDEGLRTIYVEAVDLAGNVTESAPLSVEVDRTAPKVTQVLVRGSSWGSGFLAALDTAGLGHPAVAELGYAILSGGNQLAPIPWNNVDTVAFVFDEATLVEESSIQVAGVNEPSYSTAPGGFAYDDINQVAAWTLDQALGNDKLLLILDGSFGSVMDRAGNLLDGEWPGTVPDQFPSGDGIEGGDFEFRVNVLPGDVNQNKTVSFDDIGSLVSGGHLLTGIGETGYDPLHDINANGSISFDDLGTAVNHLLEGLPNGEPGIFPAPSPEILQQASDDLWATTTQEDESTSTSPNVWDNALLGLMEDAD